MSRIIPDIVRGTSKLPPEADIVIIGGGIIGVSAAYYLARQGMKVVLCEKGLIGAEQSARNWGWVRQMGREATEIPLAMRSIELWRGLNAELGLETGYRQSGITYLCRNDRELEEYRQWVKTARDFGVDTQLVDHKEAVNILPGMRELFIGGMYTASDGRAEPTLAAPALALAAERLGATLLPNCAVRGIEKSGGSVSAVVTERGVVRTKQIVLAGGAWSRLFARSLGIELPCLKVLGSVARVDGVSNLPDMPVGASNFAFRKRIDGGYTVSMRNGNLVPLVPDSFRLFSDFFPQLLTSWRELKLRVGPSFFEEAALSSTWALDQETIFERIRVLDPAPKRSWLMKGIRIAARAFPELEKARVTQTWAGLIDTTPDAVPVIGPVAQLPGLFFATGFSGHGFGIGPASGELIAQMICGKTTRVDPTPFRYERFGKQASLKTA